MFKVYFIEVNIVIRQILFGSFKNFDAAENFIIRHLYMLYDDVGEINISVYSENCFKFSSENHDDFFIIREEKENNEKGVGFSFPIDRLS